jgi:hypothetical protein
MPFPIIPILTAIPSILSAYKTVKDLDKNPHKVKTPTDSKVHNTNLLKRETAVELLTPLLLTKIRKRGGDIDDLGTLVDFACFIYKMVRGKGK